MKTKKQIKLITDAIKNTTTWEVGNIELEASNERVNVWTTETLNGSFHAVEIGAMAQAMGYNAYVTYNELKQRCELSIF